MRRPLFANYVSVTDYVIGLGVEGKIYADGNYVKVGRVLVAAADLVGDGTGCHGWPPGYVYWPSGWG